MRCTAKLRDLVKGELWSLLCLACNLHCFLGVGISEAMVVTDASTTGGAIGVASEISTEGKNLVQAVRVQEHASVALQWDRRFLS